MSREVLKIQRFPVIELERSPKIAYLRSYDDSLPALVFLKITCTNMYLLIIIIK